MTALKAAEEGADTIILHETEGHPADATVRLLAWGRTIRARFRPGEIKTFRVPSEPALPVVEADLLERPLGT